MKQKAVPVINRTIWMVLLGILVAENAYLYATRTVEPETKSRPGLDVNETIVMGYPRLVCTAGSTGNTGALTVYNEKEYKFIPDQYDSNHYLVVPEVNGTLKLDSPFSVSRCQVVK